MNLYIVYVELCVARMEIWFVSNSYVCVHIALIIRTAKLFGRNVLIKFLSLPNLNKGNGVYTLVVKLQTLVSTFNTPTH